MPDPNDNDDNTVDPKVKDLIDSSTREDLERWFGLPSYEALADRGIHPEPTSKDDPELAERRKRQDTALAAIDPALVEAHRRRTDSGAELVKPPPEIHLHVDPEIMQLDEAMIQRQGVIAEPREVQRAPDLEDAVRERTPQALLRDLHRPELYFDKSFQRVDMIADYRIDVGVTVREIMGTSSRLPPPALPLFQEGYALVKELRAERQQPWINIEMPRRRVTE